MPQRTMKTACDRFRSEISAEDATRIEATASIEEVKSAIVQVERHRAAEQSYRDMDRITPFIDAIERYSKYLTDVADAAPYLPWIWAFIKFVLLAVQDHTYALDTILSAYGIIGRAMSPFPHFAEAFSDDHLFQDLLGFLFEDILEFHRLSYSMIKKPGWEILFPSAWRGFDHRFRRLSEGIARVSDSIVPETVSLDSMQAIDQRKKEAEASAMEEARQRTREVGLVLSWLAASDTYQDFKFNVLGLRHDSDTLLWVTRSPKIESWLQRAHGEQVLWLHGKPGSGKSSLAAKLISDLRDEPTKNVCFFFCGRDTTVRTVSTEISKTLAAQMLRISPEAAAFVYGEYVAHGKTPTADILEKLLPQLITTMNDIWLIIDGLDEVSSSEHPKLMADLLHLTKDAPQCKMLLISQDVTSISDHLSEYSQLSMADEDANIQKDLAVVVSRFLGNLNGRHGDALEERAVRNLEAEILRKAEGTFLSVYLILRTLHNVSRRDELLRLVSSLPATLSEAYSNILDSMASRCPADQVATIHRVFAWMMYHKGREPLRDSQVRIGASLFPGNEILTVKTKPLPNGNPLINCWTHEYLMFVHSTVPHFLEEHQTLSRHGFEPKASIAYACVCQLSQGLDLLLPSSTSSPAVYIALGLFSLLPYAFEHWLEHVLDCLEIRGNIMTQQVQTLLNRVELFCRQILKLDTCRLRNDGASMTQECQDQRFIDLVANIGLSASQSMVILRNSSAITDYESSSAPLARARMAYQRNVEVLLTEVHIDGVSQKDLLTFKELHRPTAFLCNIHGCERAVVGFPSRKERKDHQLFHSELLKCLSSGCSCNVDSFKTDKGLEEHMEGKHELEPVPSPR